MDEDVNKQENQLQSMVADHDNVISHDFVGKMKTLLTQGIFLKVRLGFQKEGFLKIFYLLSINSLGILACYRTSLTM